MFVCLFVFFLTANDSCSCQHALHYRTTHVKPSYAAVAPFVAAEHSLSRLPHHFNWCIVAPACDFSFRPKLIHRYASYV